MSTKNKKNKLRKIWEEQKQTEIDLYSKKVNIKSSLDIESSKYLKTLYEGDFEEIPTTSSFTGISKESWNSVTEEDQTDYKETVSLSRPTGTFNGALDLAIDADLIWDSYLFSAYAELGVYAEMSLPPNPEWYSIGSISKSIEGITNKQWRISSNFDISANTTGTYNPYAKFGAAFAYLTPLGSIGLALNTILKTSGSFIYSKTNLSDMQDSYYTNVKYKNDVALSMRFTDKSRAYTITIRYYMGDSDEKDYPSEGATNTWYTFLTDWTNCTRNLFNDYKVAVKTIYPNLTDEMILDMIKDSQIVIDNVYIYYDHEGRTKYSTNHIRRYATSTAEFINDYILIGTEGGWMTFQYDLESNEFTLPLHHLLRVNTEILGDFTDDFFIFNPDMTASVYFERKNPIFIMTKRYNEFLGKFKVKVSGALFVYVENQEALDALTLPKIKLLVNYSPPFNYLTNRNANIK